MLLHGMNDDIIIPHPYYWGVYQYEAKTIRALQNDKYIFGLEPKQKNWENDGALFSINIGNLSILISSLRNLIGAGCSGLIDGEMCTAIWVILSSALWRLLVPLLLFNSPSSCCRLGYHGVWIIYPPFQKWVKEPLLIYDVKLHRFSVYSSESCNTFWYHHLVIKLVPSLHSTSV